MEKVDYIGRALIRLKRKYGKDELVKSLLNEISEYKIEVGKLKSEIDFLNEELNLKKEQKEIIRESRISARKEELYRLKDLKIKQLRKDNKTLRELRDNLFAKTNKLESIASHNFLRHLVDVVWMDVNESTEVPATNHADTLIKKAEKTYTNNT